MAIVRKKTSRLLSFTKAPGVSAREKGVTSRKPRSPGFRAYRRAMAQASRMQAEGFQPADWGFLRSTHTRLASPEVTPFAVDTTIQGTAQFSFKLFDRMVGKSLSITLNHSNVLEALTQDPEPLGAAADALVMLEDNQLTMAQLHRFLHDAARLVAAQSGQHPSPYDPVLRACLRHPLLEPKEIETTLTDWVGHNVSDVLYMPWFDAVLENPSFPFWQLAQSPFVVLAEAVQWRMMALLASKDYLGPTPLHRAETYTLLVRWGREVRYFVRQSVESDPRRRAQGAQGAYGVRMRATMVLGKKSKARRRPLRSSSLGGQPVRPMGWPPGTQVTAKSASPGHPVVTAMKPKRRQGDTVYELASLLSYREERNPNRQTRPQDALRWMQRALQLAQMAYEVDEALDRRYRPHPLSALVSPPEGPRAFEVFAQAAAEWKEQEHLGEQAPARQVLLDLKWRAVPLILTQMPEAPTRWAALLRAITRTPLPVTGPSVVQRWRGWARRERIIPSEALAKLLA